MSSRQKFRRDIQGLRGLGVIFVVLFHAGFGFIPGGYIGVDVFFVISGYLIFGLILREIDSTQALDVLGFYARRIRRILPAACLVIVVTLAVVWALDGPIQIEAYSFTAFTTAVYGSNIRFAQEATDYLAVGTMEDPLLHTWSLAVEEQFYIVWPLLIWTIIRFSSPERRRRNLLLAVLGTSLLSFALSIYLLPRNQPWAFFGAPTRAWEFGAGALLAFAPRNLLPAGRSILPRAVATIGLFLICVAAFAFSTVTPFPGWAALLPVTGAAALMWAGHSGSYGAVETLLTAAPIRRIGDISYSLYLWHWPILVFLIARYGELDHGLRFLGITASILLAAASYRLVENPVRFSSVLQTRRLATFALGIVITGTAVGAALGMRQAAVRELATPEQVRFVQALDDVPRVYADGCHVRFRTIAHPECAYGDPVATRSMVLFGDSHAAQWFPALESLAIANGYRLYSFTKSGCPAVDVEVTPPELKRRYVECEQWRLEILARIRALSPDFVFTSNSFHAVARLSASDRETQLLLWKAGLERTIRKLRDSDASVVVIRDTPWIPEAGPLCLSRASWTGSDPVQACQITSKYSDSREVLDAEMEVVTETDRAALFDFSTEICPSRSGEGCPVERNDLIVYRDDHHITATFARQLHRSFSSKFSALSASRTKIETGQDQ